MSDSASSNAGDASYRVLARKYRPTTFAELVGQEIMVRTLTNALESGRLAHAFVLTGVRGVGKTTTARIIARALNCVGPDGTGEPTDAPCGVCEQCIAISEDRHVDVLEIDAASHTGVADVRELIDGVRYAPVSARYKIYIIDEVHMLSTQAFNALLKTLEEPPPRVKFIFATTEIRKIPITVLSRCQRFDLRRLDGDTMLAFLGDIAAKEAVTAEPGALQLIARAAEGSARDGLSLLDQAIAHGGEMIDEALIGEMLGLADRGRVLDLLDTLFAGDLPAALQHLADMNAAGADPIVIVQDLLELTHWLTRLKVTPEAGEDLAVAETQRKQGREMVDKLSVAMIARAWQMLLKGLQEAQTAPMPLIAVEMLLVRLAYVADIPDPAELLRQVKGDESGDAKPEAAIETPVGEASSPPAKPSAAADEAVVGAANGMSGPASAQRSAQRSAQASAQTSAQARPFEVPSPDPVDPVAANPDRADTVEPPTLDLSDFDALVALVERQREPTLHAALLGDVHLVHYEQGRLELRLEDRVPRDFTHRLQTLLEQWTGRRWVVSISGEPGAPTIQEQRLQHTAALRESVADHPLVATTLATFPDAEIRDVRRVGLAQVDYNDVLGDQTDDDAASDDGDEV